MRKGFNKVGIYLHPDGSLTIIYEGESRNRLREKWLPANAVAVLRQNWGVVIKNEEVKQEEVIVHPRQTDIAIQAVHDLPGLSGPALAGQVLYLMGEDDQDLPRRRQTLSSNNGLAERKLIFRDFEDRFWPIDSEEARTRPPWGSEEQTNLG